MTIDTGVLLMGDEDPTAYTDYYFGKTAADKYWRGGEAGSNGYGGPAGTQQTNGFGYRPNGFGGSGEQLIMGFAVGAPVCPGGDHVEGSLDPDPIGDFSECLLILPDYSDDAWTCEPTYRETTYKVVSGSVGGSYRVGPNAILPKYCNEDAPAAPPTGSHTGGLFTFNGSWQTAPASGTPSVGIAAARATDFNSAVVTFYQPSSIDTYVAQNLWKINVSFAEATSSGVSAYTHTVKERLNADGTWSFVSDTNNGPTSATLSGTFDWIGVSEDELTAGTQPSAYFESVGGSFSFDANSNTAAGSVYLHSPVRCALEGSLPTTLYEYRDPPSANIPTWQASQYVRVGILRMYPLGAPFGGFSPGDKMRATADRTTNATFDGDEVTNWELFVPQSTSNWTASSSVAEGDYRKATAAVGGFAIGQIIISKSTRTTRSSFDATESGNWKADAPEVVVVATMAMQFQNVSISVS